MKSGFESFAARKLAAQARASAARLKRVRWGAASRRVTRASKGVGTWTARGLSPALLIKLHGGSGQVSDAYAQRDPDAELLLSNLLGLTARQRAAEWAADAARHPRVNPRHVHLHFSISLAPSLCLDAERWREIVKRQLQICGFAGCAFIVIRHKKEGHDHVHVIASRSGPDGGLVSLSQGRWRFRSALRQVEAELGLKAVDRLVNPMRPTDAAVNAFRRSQRRGTGPAWIDPQSILSAVHSSTNPAQLSIELKKRGIDIQISRRSNGPARGVMFRRSGAEEWLAGTSISRELSLLKIQRQIELNAKAWMLSFQPTLQPQHREVSIPQARTSGNIFKIERE